MIGALVEGFSVMLIGMGTVFVFLVILVLLMHFTSFILKYINKIFPEQVIEINKKNKCKSVNSDDEIAVAIATAVNFNK